MPRLTSKTKLPRSLLSNIVLLVLSCVFVLGAIEIIFRLTRPPHGELTMGVTDSLHHHKLEADQVLPNGFGTKATLNKYGLRGSEFTLEKKPGVERVLFLGDSFTWGSGVEDDENFPAMMDAYLNEHRFPVEVLNGGFASYSPLLHYLRFRDEFVLIKPDHVFLFYDLTDLQDDFNYERHLVKDKDGRLIGCNPMYIDGRLNFWKVLTAKSSFARYIHNKVVRTFQKIRVIGLAEYIKLKMAGKRTRPYLVNMPVLEKMDIDMLPYDRYIMIRDRSRLPLVQKHWPRSAKYILLLRDFLAERGISFTLVLYPHGPQVSAKQWQDGKEMWGFERDKVYDDPYAWDYIKRWAVERNVPLMDLLPHFKKHSEEELFFKADVHFTVRGHEVLAEGILADELFRQTVGLDKVRFGTLPAQG